MPAKQCTVGAGSHCFSIIAPSALNTIPNLLPPDPKHSLSPSICVRMETRQATRRGNIPPAKQNRRGWSRRGRAFSKSKQPQPPAILQPAPTSPPQPRPVVLQPAPTAPRVPRTLPTSVEAKAEQEKEVEMGEQEEDADMGEAETSCQAIIDTAPAPKPTPAAVVGTKPSSQPIVETTPAPQPAPTVSNDARRAVQQANRRAKRAEKNAAQDEANQARIAEATRIRLESQTSSETSAIP